MDAKRKFSEEKDLCLNDGKRNKMVTPENEGVIGNGTRGSSKTELDVLVDVPIVSSKMKEKIFERYYSVGSSLKHIAIRNNTGASSSSGGRDGPANIFSLHGNEFVEIHVSSELEEMHLAEKNQKCGEEMMKDKDKGKSIFDLKEIIWPKEGTVSNPFEKREGIFKNCEHFWIWKKGVGHVCWKCDIDRKYLVPPGFKPRNIDHIKLKVPEDGLSGTDVILHPSPKFRSKENWERRPTYRHEIADFLLNNLFRGIPNGCILAQAPIFEKAYFMSIIIDYHLKDEPTAKPLFLLPRWMISSWKNWFPKILDELKVSIDFKLLDLYSDNANTRAKQLAILKSWLGSRSIIFLGHKLFCNMVSDKSDDDQVSKECRDILLNEPTLAIFDRGTDPRNEMPRFLKEFARIKTPSKVLPSGPVYQSNIKEVFSDIDIVCPEFLKHNRPGDITGNILNIDGASSIPMFDKLEETILSQDTPHGVKNRCLTELRTLTRNVVYNHKGGRLFLPSVLFDLTVVLNLSLNQRSALEYEKKYGRGKGFRTDSTLSGITLHPILSVFSGMAKGQAPPTEAEMDALLQDVDAMDGVKTKFFLGLAKLCEYTNEKLLVVSQYVIPLIFLQRLMAKIKGWKDGKETFILIGNTSPAARESSIRQFKTSPDAKIFFASIKSCNEETSFDGATRILMLDIIGSPCMARQAIEMVYNIEQEREDVYSYRLVAADNAEEDKDTKSAAKEVIAGIWFDGEPFPPDEKFQIPTVEAKLLKDKFLEASFMSEDIKTIYKR